MSTEPAATVPAVAPPPAVRALSVAQLAQRWGVSADAVRRMIRSGRLDSFRVGVAVRVPLAAIERHERGAA